MKKVALHNLGCKVNSYELEVMQQNLIEKGFEIVPFEQKADIYVVNTCSVTNIADRKSRQMLHKAKKENPEALVVAVGCYVQTRPAQEILEDGVDLLVGNNRKSELSDIILSYLDGLEENRDHVPQIGQEKTYEDMSLTRTAEHTRAYIKVQDGCNQFCSYCIIPFARGRVRSRSTESILREIGNLAASGYREVVLTGIHLSSYGSDFSGENTALIGAENANNLLDLIRKVHEIEGIDRIRLGSLEPRIITEDFAKNLSKLPKICPHFHLSLQSGCRETLERMNRHYTPEEYMEGVELLNKYFDRPALTTDVIVGFPGETEEEFAESAEFVKNVGFFETHIFRYSKRAGTRAAVMEGQLTEKEKAERAHRLSLVHEANKNAYLKRITGKPMELLLEEELAVGERKFIMGYTKEYVRCGLEVTGLERRENADGAWSYTDGAGYVYRPGIVVLGETVLQDFEEAKNSAGNASDGDGERLREFALFHRIG